MHLSSSVRACGLKLPHVLFASPRLAYAPAQSSSRRTVVMKSTGKFLVGGNWKCNGTLDSVSKLISELNSAKIPDDIEVVVAPTFVHLQLAVDKLSPRYQVSAQNCWVGKQGAYTGEVGIHWGLLYPPCHIVFPLRCPARWQDELPMPMWGGGVHSSTAVACSSCYVRYTQTVWGVTWG